MIPGLLESRPDMARVVIIGGGIAGLTTALVLGRDGHDVTLCERDPARPPAIADAAFSAWPRRGVAQFFHPHSFLGRARELLESRLPDVYEQLLAAGARVIDFSAKLPTSERVPGDERMKTLACRRAVLEWMLRRAVEREVRVRLVSGVDVEGLSVARSATCEPRITGVRTAGHGVLDADLVVDAGGRRSGLARWLASDAGVALFEEARDCETIYYSRHYVLRPGAERPEGSWLLGPGAELGFMRFSLDEGDSGTFALTICACPSEGRLRALRHEPVWFAVAQAFPGFSAWLDRATPVTGVLPMGSLRNVLRRFVVDGRPLVTGVVAMGDAICHTNPQHAWGASLAIHHACAVGDALAEHAADPDALALAYHAAIGDDTERRFRSSAAEDQARRRWNEGEAIDPRSPNAAPGLFVRHVVYPASFADPGVFRAVARRINLIDPPDALERDRALHERAIAGYARLYPDGPTWTLKRGDVMARVARAEAALSDVERAS